MRYIQRDHVSRLHQRERPACRGFRRSVENNCSISSAAHTRIGNADHIFHAFAQKLGRQQHIADFGHPGIAARAAILENHHAAFVDVQRLLIDACMKIFDRFEDHSATAMLQQVRAGRRYLDHSAIRRKIAAQNCDPCVLLERFGKAVNHVAIPAGCVGHIFPNGSAIGGVGITVERASFAELAQHCGQTARVEKVLHQILS